MEVYKYAKQSNPELNMPEWSESDTIAYRHYKLTYPNDLQTQARMCRMIINDIKNPVVAVLVGEYEGKCPSYYFRLQEEAVLPFENQNLPEPPLEEKTDGGRFISPPPPPSSPLGNNLDESNKKAAKILVTKGGDEAAKYMLESCGNDYAMRMMYG